MIDTAGQNPAEKTLPARARHDSRQTASMTSCTLNKIKVLRSSCLPERERRLTLGAFILVGTCRYEH